MESITYGISEVTARSLRFSRSKAVINLAGAGVTRNLRPVADLKNDGASDATARRQRSGSTLTTALTGIGPYTWGKASGAPPICS